MSRRFRNNLIILLLVVVTVFVSVKVFASMVEYFADRRYQKNIENESFTEVDTYKLSVYSEENAVAALKALKSGSKDKLEKLFTDKTDVTELMEYADWSSMDEERSRTLGGGSYMYEPDSNGRMDFGETYWIRIGKKTYVMYIQTVCSRYGKANDGISAIAATTWEHYDSIHWLWEWQTDKNEVLAGTPYSDK